MASTFLCLLLLIKQYRKMEVARKSVLDYIREMERSNVCRLIFCAKITNSEKIIQSFNLIIKEYSTEHITGLLLVYSDFLIHLIEASEDDVFQLCDKLCSVNSEIMTHIKCIYVQNGAKRFFQKWYSKKMNDNTLNNDNLEMFEDNFANASSIYKIMILNLHKLFWELQEIKNCDLIERLDLISTNGHSNIPCKKHIEFILQSYWGYNLIKLLKDYCDLNYSCDFDDYSSVSEIIQAIEYNYN